MKVATILVSATLLLSPAAAMAQGVSSVAPDKPMRGETVRVPRASPSTRTAGSNENDRAIDAELRRIDRMMTICTGC